MDAAFVPSTPFFDTSSSDEKSQDSEFTYNSPSKRGRGRPRRQSRPARDSDDSTTPTPMKRGRGRPRKHVPESDDSDDAVSPNLKNHLTAESNKGKQDQYLNARARIISGRFTGLVGRIDRIVVSGWIYIADNDAIDRPVRWSEIKILDEEEYEAWKSENENQVSKKEDTSKANKKGKVGNICNVRGCGKFQQRCCDGFCKKHHNAYLNGDLDIEGNEVESSPSTGPMSQKRDFAESQEWLCKFEGCTRYRKSTNSYYCGVHQGKKHAGISMKDIDDDTDAGNTSQEQVEPDLIGAKVRLTHPSFAGTTGIIVNKQTGIILEIKWQSIDANNTPETTQHLEDVKVSNTSMVHEFSNNPTRKYRGAIVDKDGVTGRVENVIEGEESYTTDCAGMEKTFLRNEFIVLNYGDGAVSEGRLKNDGDDESHEIDEYSTESVDSGNADESVHNDNHGGHGLNGDNDSPGPSNISPLIGATVFIVSGKFKGKIGKVTEMCRQGWWGVDGLARRVQTSQFKIVDDGFLNVAAMKDFFQNRTSRGRPIPPVEKLDKILSTFNADLVNLSEKEKDSSLLETPFQVQHGKCEELESGDNPKSIYNEKVGDVHIGVTVRVKRGNKHAGYTGKITSVYHRGWWQVEGLEAKVQARHVDIVDDGHLDMDALKKYYRISHNGTEMPKDVGNAYEDIDGESSRNDHIPSRRAIQRQKRKSSSIGPLNSKPPIDTEPNKCFKHKISSTDFGGAKGRETSEQESIVKWDRKPATYLSVPNVPKLNTTQHIRRKRTPSLDPFLIESNPHFDGTDSEDIEKQPSLKLFPKGLRHLPPDTLVEIFNRRTGRVMRGDDAIALGDLPAALLDHAEYEPIVPRSGNVDTPYRTGRTSSNICVSKEVISQCRVRTSLNEGKRVLVTGGQFRGRIGTIDSCMPGGWYLISHLFKSCDLSNTAVINSSQLEIVDDKSSSRLKALQLRLSALEEQRENCKTSSKCDLTLDPKLEIEIHKIKAILEDRNSSNEDINQIS